MTISYNWLHDYLPVTIDPERLSKILTSIGLEVEHFENFESHKGGLRGLVIGEVLECITHPNAEKLKLATVDIANGKPLQIVCGAPNVQVGQKVIVAPAGTTIYPHGGEPVTMKVAKIRGVESYGMICAEDEIGLSENHAGIIVLSDDVKTGSPASTVFNYYTDLIYEIGLTPNRMDAMSHLGVAKDICAYLAHHDKKAYTVKSPFIDDFKSDNNSLQVAVTIENVQDCQRYSGVSLTNITVKESPQWLQQKLRAIGQRPINNIVDITNFILHETGQPLHAFDAGKINGNQILVKNLPEGTIFKTLDEKDRKLSKDDLMICNRDSEGMCIAGVFGGVNSGVNRSTQNIFLESAWFNPVTVRKTSFRHALRTDAAMRFEKNVDINNTVKVLKRAAKLIKQIAGGEISSDVIDVFPHPIEKNEVILSRNYLKKLSGKNYDSETVKNILHALDFEVFHLEADHFRVLVPFSKPDISLQADVVEEIMRIDGYDSIEIPSSITITPSIETDSYKHVYKEKVANYLVGLGFNEIFTNSITNSAYFDDADIRTSVRLLNNLSAVHNIMRPSMLETGLEAVAYNLNRKNTDLRLFEFGKTYYSTEEGNYHETDYLCFYITGNKTPASWKTKSEGADIYYLKGIVTKVLRLLGITEWSWSSTTDNKLEHAFQISFQNHPLIRSGQVQKHELNRFDIKQPVFFASVDWRSVLNLLVDKKIQLKELPRQLPVYRDLAMVVPKALPYEAIENALYKINLNKLREIKLFDIFESEKLGHGKKSLAINIMFLDEEKTLTDAEIDQMMKEIMNTLEKNLHAEIRK